MKCGNQQPKKRTQAAKHSLRSIAHAVRYKRSTLIASDYMIQILDIFVIWGNWEAQRTQRYAAYYSELSCTHCCLSHTKTHAIALRKVSLATQGYYENHSLSLDRLLERTDALHVVTTRGLYYYFITRALLTFYYIQSFMFNYHLIFQNITVEML